MEALQIRNAQFPSMLQVWGCLERSVLTRVIEKSNARRLFGVGVHLQVRAGFIIGVAETKTVTSGAKNDLADLKKIGFYRGGEEITESL